MVLETRNRTPVCENIFLGPGICGTLRTDHASLARSHANQYRQRALVRFRPSPSILRLSMEIKNPCSLALSVYVFESALGSVIPLGPAFISMETQPCSTSPSGVSTQDRYSRFFPSAIVFNRSGVIDFKKSAPACRRSARSFCTALMSRISIVTTAVSITDSAYAKSFSVVKILKTTNSPMPVCKMNQPLMARISPVGVESQKNRAGSPQIFVGRSDRSVNSFPPALKLCK